MTRKTIIIQFLAGVLCIAAAGVLWMDGLATAQEGNETSAPAVIGSPLHPAFVLRDGQGGNVLESGKPVSTMQTCGSCHDTPFIAEHSVHTDVGQQLAGEVDGLREWQTGIGWYGGWNPITYLASSDLSADEWAQAFGWRHVGGGPAEELGIEMNCFLCHFETPNNDARIQTLDDQAYVWGSTATLEGSGVVMKDGEVWVYNTVAFNEAGELLPEYITISKPSSTNCGFCHGLVDTQAEIPLTFDPFDGTQWNTMTTGQVFAPGRISSSAMNLSDKQSLTRTWDVHAERALECADCHYSLNNPVFYVEPEASRPNHLDFDPRRMDFGDYLLRPLHQFANGGSEYIDAFPVFERSVRDCASCHNAEETHDWLEYASRHMEALACETCHIPNVYAPALESVDWTVLTTGGQPQMSYRGADPTAEVTYISGYQPVLLPDRDGKLAPYNLISAWYWIYGDPAQPVAVDDLAAVYLDGDDYAADVVTAFDIDADDHLSETELVIDTADKETFIAAKLSALGLDNPRIMGETEPYAINHNVTHGEWAIRDCSTCHTEDSRLSQPVALSSRTPGDVTPTLLDNADGGSLQINADGVVMYTSTLDIGAVGLYVLGHHSVSLVDWAGALIFLASLGGVVLHGGLRYLAARRMPVPEEPELREVYMYSVYERQWHWLQTAVIFGLLFTGMVIHKPDMFGMFYFRGVVLLHNAFAVILIVNAALAAFYHLASSEIRQFLPQPRGFFNQMFAQARYYMYGIFRDEPHPFEKTRNRKMNPIQQITYLGLLNVLLPLQVITGGLMWGAQHAPGLTEFFGGLPLLAPVHTMVSWLMATFIVVHVYMTTTGHTPLANIRAMIFGWDEVEVHAPSTGD